jgi:hypothetical protein
VRIVLRLIERAICVTTRHVKRVYRVWHKNRTKNMEIPVSLISGLFIETKRYR